ncbi:hypothetical protein REPUB_Repub01dG0178800 [Reevesia pubescens]
MLGSGRLEGDIENRRHKRFRPVDASSSWRSGPKHFQQGFDFVLGNVGEQKYEVKNNVKNTPARTSSFAMQYLEDFKKAQQGDVKKLANARGTWKKPKHGFMKVNFDGAVNAADGVGGSGVIIRDEEGEVLTAGSFAHLGLQDPLICEATAALDAITFAANLGLQKIIVEGDAARVVSNWGGQFYYWKPGIGQQIEDV